MNSVNSKVILKKLNRLNNVSKHAEKLIVDISKGATEIRPVYKVPDKLTIINVFNEIIKILIKLNINFVVENNAPRKGRIGLKVIIKTKVLTKTPQNGNNTTKTPTAKR